MSTRSGRRRAMVLPVVLVIIVLAAGMLSFLAMAAAERYRALRHQQVAVAVRAIAQSATVLARSHPPAESGEDSGAPVVIRPDISDLLPPEISGEAMITFDGDGASGVAHIEARASRGPIELVETFDVRVD